MKRSKTVAFFTRVCYNDSIEKRFGEREMFDFITDLDEYFCEKYANYDKLCVLNGYKMPVMPQSGQGRMPAQIFSDLCHSIAQAVLHKNSLRSTLF